MFRDATVIEGEVSATDLRLGIVVARFNSFITEQLLAGAVDVFYRHGGSAMNLVIVRVPGSFELPFAAKKLAESGAVDGIAAIGAVVRGATSHYDLVCKESAGGISSVALTTGIPVAFGVITTDTLEQAIERAGTKAGNKGADAMLAALEMISVGRQIGKLSSN